jgi:hypothetical protein
MAQLASLATLVGTGASIYGSVRAAQEQNRIRKAQNAALQAQAAERAEQLRIQRDADARSRQEALARTIAGVRARLAAGGVRPDEGSAAALAAGLRQDAAIDQSEDDALVASRIAQGRRSLLNPDGTLTAFLRSGQTFGSALRNLLT